MDTRTVLGLALLAAAAFAIASPVRPFPPLSFSKLVYTALLIGGSFLLLREVGSVWGRPTTSLGVFKLTVEGTSDEVRADALRVKILQRYVQLNGYFAQLDNQLKAEAEAENTAQSDSRIEIVPSATSDLGLTRDQLAEIELKIQGVNFGQILGMLRRSVVTPDEVTGYVVLHSGNGKPSAVVRWPGAPKFEAMPDESNKLMSFDEVESEADLATQIACSLIWAQVAGIKDSPLIGMRRAQYCDWAEALLIWRDLAERSAAQLEFRDEDKVRLKIGREKIERLVAQGVAYRDVYRLRAALISLDSEASKLDRETEDLSRLIYAQLIQGVPLQVAKENAQQSKIDLALNELAQSTSEPGLEAVVRLPNAYEGRSADFTSKIDPSTTIAIGEVTGAVLMPGRSEPFIGTGFIVKKGWVLTSSVVANVMAKSTDPGQLGVFSLDSDPRFKEAESFPIREVRQVRGSDDLSLLLVPGLSGELSVLPLIGQDSVPLDIPVGVVGYPVGQVPVSESIRSILGGRSPAKRTMFGVVIEAQPADPMNLGHDAPTFPGTAGAPVFDLQTGRVLAVHQGGRVTEDGGKVNFATRITPEIAEWISGL
ncbi:MAG: serine protease [Paracoccaceae bacterium]|jgi:hypothetical protein